MKKNVLNIFILIFCYFLTGCNNNQITNEEIEILSKNFQTQIMNFAPTMETQKEGRSIIQLINTIATNVRNNLKIKNSRKEVIKTARNIISDKDFNKLKYDSKNIGEYIKSNLPEFESEKMSLIKEYNFVNKIFQFYYWKNWKCDLGRGFKLVNHSLDTMILFEYEEYEIPISVYQGNNYHNPYRIISNSLQEKDKNKIHFKTGKSKNGVLKKEFEITVFNKITGEEFKENESIEYKIIKK